MEALIALGPIVVHSLDCGPFRLASERNLLCFETKRSSILARDPRIPIGEPFAEKRGAFPGHERMHVDTLHFIRDLGQVCSLKGAKAKSWWRYYCTVPFPINPHGEYVSEVAVRGQRVVGQKLLVRLLMSRPHAREPAARKFVTSPIYQNVSLRESASSKVVRYVVFLEESFDIARFRKPHLPFTKLMHGLREVGAGLSVLIEPFLAGRFDFHQDCIYLCRIAGEHQKVRMACAGVSGQ